MLNRTEGVTLPDGISPDDEAAFWQALAQLTADYSALAKRRKANPPKAELKRWQRNVKLLDRLEGFDPFKVAALKDQAETHVVGYWSINKESRGHSGLPQLFLYFRVLNLWRVQLKRDLKYSRNDNGPYGPLIDFFAAVVKPILGDKAPGAAGIASIIDDERNRVAERKRRHTNSSAEK
jgi:hypothetical protein